MSVSVSVRNGNVEKSLRMFKVGCAKDGTLAAVRNRKEYKKPGVVRREEKKKNTQNCRRNNKNYR